jgi:hypothetical protein
VLVASGAVLFGVAYIASVFSASGSDGPTSGDSDYVYLFYPVVGPMIMATKVRSPWLALADGAAQTGGVALFITGLVWRQTTLVRADEARRVYLAPTIGRGFTGLSLRGQF